MRTILADGEPTVRSALRVLLTQDLDMQVVGEADTAEALLRQVRLHEPRLLVVAWNLVAANAGSALSGLRLASPGLRIVVLGLRPETRQVALAAGADGFISKVVAPEDVVRVLEGCHVKESRPAAQGAGPSKRRSGAP
jgi:DNA-binding NarL/FixJ family response regulator